MSASIIDIPMEHVIPAGILGPSAVPMSVRAYLMPHAGGLTLVDTGLDPTGGALDDALAGSGARWSDVSDVVITHAHPDHVGALDHIRTVAAAARIHAHPLEGLEGTLPLADGDSVNGLRALATPGHTPGHLSLVDNDHGVLLVGDCLGVVEGQLVRAPAAFTADAPRAEESLHRLLSLRGARMLFAHGPELSEPWAALDALLDG
jgi:glyoxylase-like metal-dependent hydrolase (beta-lactamase superfamily II)